VSARYSVKLLPFPNAISRQKNVDYAVCNALQQAASSKKALVVYDVVCQWSRNFRARVARCPALSLPAELSLSYGIGDFHLHGHIPECFPRFSLANIPGAGIIDGEIVETLWSVLNHISPSTRNASLAHRAELLNDHMNYSNWKKLTMMGNGFFGTIFN
jgi:hypothetical protein